MNETRQLDDVLTDRTGSEIHEALRELRRRGWICGDDRGTDGSWFEWYQLTPTLDGLRQLGEWPSPEQEHLPGPWDSALWGSVDRPVLAKRAEAPERQFVFRAQSYDSADAWREWKAHLRLLQAGLIDGEMQEGGISDCSVTEAGNKVLNPPPDDPLDRAIRELRQNKKREAVTAAVDEALKHRLHALANKAGTKAHTKKGREKQLSEINEELEAAGVYDRWVANHVSAWTETRNEVIHRKPANVDNAWIELMVQGIRLFLREHPV
jgi:hypothetical protein